MLKQIREKLPPGYWFVLTFQPTGVGVSIYPPGGKPKISWGLDDSPLEDQLMAVANWCVEDAAAA